MNNPGYQRTQSFFLFAPLRLCENLSHLLRMWASSELLWKMPDLILCDQENFLL